MVYFNDSYDTLWYKISLGHLNKYSIIKKNLTLTFLVGHTLTFLLVCDINMFEAAKLDCFFFGKCMTSQPQCHIKIQYKCTQCIVNIGVLSWPRNHLSCFANNISKFVSVWHKIIFKLAQLPYAIVMLYKMHHYTVYNLVAGTTP